MLADLYEREFYATNITKAELCDKYNISMSDLAHIKEPELETELETTPATVVNEPKQTLPAKQTQTQPTTNSSEEGEFLTSIYSFKKAALEEARSQLVSNYELDSRELKNLVSTVDILEKSVTKTDGAGNTVTIMVQNIMNKYNDDC